MAAELNHTIVWCSDQKSASAFVADMLGLPEPKTFARFHVVEMANGVSLDFANRDGAIAPQHYAFLVSDAEFDSGMAKIAEKGLKFWADPAGSKRGEINHLWGGRGVYFEGPDGHSLELITKAYSSTEDL